MNNAAILSSFVYTGFYCLLLLMLIFFLFCFVLLVELVELEGYECGKGREGKGRGWGGDDGERG